MDQPDSEFFILQEPTPFGKSIIWEMQEAYYNAAGIDAWRKNQVPFYITSNPVMGKAYAEIVFAFLKDYRRKNISLEKVYLLELGAGHGGFCYQFLKHFERLIDEYISELPALCYIVSDRVKANLSFCKSHPQLQPFIKKGLVDFANIDITDVTEILLELSGQSITANSLTQPLFVVANYVFDSIPHDLFYVKDGTLQEVWLGLLLDKRYEASSKKEILENLKLAYYTHSLGRIPYSQEYLYKIIQQYIDILSDKYIHFPNVALQTIHDLRALAPNGLMLLTADKGYHQTDELNYQSAPQLVTHGGCFSLSVNFHAFKEYCINENGLAVFPENPAQNIYIGCLLFVSCPSDYIETIQAYNRTINNFNPDDYFVVRRMIMKHFREMTLREVLATIRMSRYDSCSIIELLPRIQELLPTGISNIERVDLFQTVNKVWDMYYHMEEEQNLPFMLAELLFKLSYFKEAITFLELSGSLYGHTISTKCNLALCYFQLKQFNNAKAMIGEVLQLSPCDNTALAYKIALEKMEDITNVHDDY